MLCKQVGVKTIIVFLNKVDAMDDPEMHEIVEMEVTELLEKYGYDPDNTVFIRGSALAALNGENPEIGEDRIRELLTTMDEKIPLPEKTTDKPFMLSIDGTYNIEGRGTVVTGTVEQGKIKAGEEIEIVGFGQKPKKTTVTAIETFKKTLDYGEGGDNVGLLIRGLTKKDVTRGNIIAKPGALSVNLCFEAQVYFTTADEGGRKKGFYSGYKPQFFLRTADIAGEILLPNNVEVCMPGDNLTISVRLANFMPVEKGLRFAMRESGKTVGHGIITNILADDSIQEGVKRRFISEKSNAE
jgi:elongation factor Tu